MEIRTCTRCDLELPRTAKYFTLNNKSKDGLGSWCKNCHSVLEAARQKKNRKKVSERQKKHRKTLKGYLVGVVGAIVQRCTNPNCETYKYYGLRGIKCCFTSNQLYDWVIKKGIEPRGKNIHRIDNDGNYVLKNVTFMDAGLHTSLHQSKIRI